MRNRTNTPVIVPLMASPMIACTTWQHVSKVWINDSSTRTRRSTRHLVFAKRSNKDTCFNETACYVFDS